MKNASEMARDVLKRRDEYDKKRDNREKRKVVKEIVAFVIPVCVVLVSFVLLLTGRGQRQETTVKAADLLEGIAPMPVTPKYDLTMEGRVMTDFGVRLLREEAKKGGNILISPISVLYSLGMLGNGAENQTRAQMEKAIGMKVEDLNLCLYSYRTALKKYSKCRLLQANSIWFRKDGKYHMNQNFLQTCADYYEADLFRLPFDDAMVREVKKWVSEKTEQESSDILNEAPQEASVCIVNALSFEAGWQQPFPEERIRYGDFQLESGETVTIRFLSGAGNLWISTDREYGFLKYYDAKEGRRYAFVALLPKGEISLEEYLEEFTGESLHFAIWSAYDFLPLVEIPIFTQDYQTDLADSLRAMGIENAFNPNLAEFGLMGSMEGEGAVHGNERETFLGEVIQKTVLSVDEQGTRAGAASMGGATMQWKIGGEDERVTLSKPFVYAVIDCQTYVPLFLGVYRVPER